MEKIKNNIPSEFPDNASEVKPKKAKLIWLAVFFLVFIAASFFGALFGFMAGGLAQKVFPDVFKSLPVSNNEIIKQRVTDEDSAVVDVVAKATPAVVSIIISKDMPKIQNFFSNPFDFPNFFDPFGNTQGNNNSGGGGAQKKTNRRRVGIPGFR